MKIAFFSSKSYDEEYFNKINEKYGHELQFFETRLDSQTVKLTKGFDAVCAFVNDKVDAKTLKGSAKEILNCSHCVVPDSTMWIWKLLKNKASPFCACRPIRPKPWPNMPWRSF